MRGSGLATTAKKGRNRMLKTDQTPRPIARGPPLVDGMAAGWNTFRATVGPEAFRGMVIWEIPVKAHCRQSREGLPER